MAKIEWVNSGEAFETVIDGEKKMVFAATIDLEDGKEVQKFQGETHKEIADKLLSAQAHATSRIRELTPPKERKQPVEFSKKPLTADDRMQIGADITDPAKAPEAINKVLESEFGAPLEQVREILQEQQDDKDKLAVQNAMRQFLEQTPDFEPCPHNENVMIKYGELHNLPANEFQSYVEIWNALKAAGLVIVKATENGDGERQPEVALTENTVTSRPRLASNSTSVRRGDSADGPTRTASKTKYTRTQIEAMSQTEYNDKLQNESGFREFVDKLS